MITYQYILTVEWELSLHMESNHGCLQTVILTYVGLSLGYVDNIILTCVRNTKSITYIYMIINRDIRRVILTHGIQQCGLTESYPYM